MVVSLPVEETKCRGRLRGTSLRCRGCVLLVSYGSLEQSAIRAVRARAGLSLWLREQCSHPALWPGADRARLTVDEFTHPRWAGRLPEVDRSHLSSVDSSSHHASRKHVAVGRSDGVAVASGHEEGLGPFRGRGRCGTPCGARTHDLRIKSPQL